MRYQIATLAVALTLSATSVARADSGNENDEVAGKVNRGCSSVPVRSSSSTRWRTAASNVSCRGAPPVPFKKSDFSIGHRGAALQFPEHTRESYEAGARMGAGILECDVTFTKDKQLVCRHGQNDLHTTTNILVTPLASTCIKPFTPAVLGPNGQVITPASAECRTSELTLAEFKTLTGKMDAFNPAAQTPAQSLGGTPDFRTNVYAGPDQRTPVDVRREHRAVQTAWRQDDTGAQGAIGDDAVQRLHAGDVCAEDDSTSSRPQACVLAMSSRSRSIDDVLYWIQHEPAFGRQAVFLDDANVVADLPTFSDLAGYRAQGIRIWAPPTFALLALDGPTASSPRSWLMTQSRRARHHHLDTGTLGHPCRRQQRLLLPDHRSGDHTRGRSLQSARRPCERRGNTWRVFRLGRASHLLRQLHGLEVAQRPLPGTPFESSLKDETACHFCNRHRTVLVLRAIEFVRLFGPRA